MAALLLLGFSSGLPLLLTGKVLQAWMTVVGVNLKSIGLFSLVALPYSLKFIWSPLMDRFVPPFFGRRRGWMVLTQVALMLTIGAMALQNPPQALQLLAINALLIAFFSASQDIAIDAYRTDVLQKYEMGAGAGIFVSGYRIASTIIPAGALFLATKMPWQMVYLLIASLTIVGLVSAIWAPEPDLEEQPPTSLKDAVILPFIDFFERSGLLEGILILLFVVLYKFGDSLLNNMSTPFLLKTGFRLEDIGSLQLIMGSIATIVGALTGGAIFSKIGMNRSLWIFGIFQGLSNLSYLMLAEFGKNYSLLVLTINIESFCGGLGTAAFFAFLMSICNKQFSATQYALLTSLMALSRDILVAPAGAIVEKVGWSNFFLITIAAALPGLLLLPVFAPWNPRPQPIPRPGLDEPEDFDL